MTLIEEITMPGPDAGIVDRIRYLLEISRKTQANFAKMIKIDPSSMSKILAEKMTVTEPFINRMVVNLGVNKLWLTEGQGQPFADGETLRQLNISGAQPATKPAGIPVYDIDATAGATPLSMMFTNENVIGYIDMPQLGRDGAIIRVSGDSMQPRISDGSYIAIRQISDMSVLVWGSVYLVQLDDYRLVKVVKPCRNDPAKITLHSYNPEYDDIEIPRESVRRLFLVEAVINCNNIA